ncbi:MFS transporter [Vibrio sp. Of7-15]|uniref:MFS transporter n=1 Tax=Vibrio sp. Of7-15 TaxID=2724879 RepID=UPI001EF21782|nr:MFS transporter [Vibrio sp. Of7-15]MCG7497949.1 MFS transporter [Vibrio sp. Of7-15]
MKQLPWNSWLLALVQPFVLSVGALNVFLGGIIGTELTTNTDFVTLPVTALILGVSLNVFPAANIQKKWGRKTAFVTAATISSLVAFLAGFSIEQESFWGFVGCSFILGTQLAYVGQYRFAAIESCKDASAHPSAISLVLLGGIAAAIVGPELLNLGQFVNIFDSQYANAYVALGVLEIIGALILLFGMKPLQIQEKAETDSEARSLVTIIKQPIFWLALGSGLTAYAVMAFLMTATPLAMQHHGHDIQHAKWVIQSHVVAMYLPSLFTAFFIKHLGLYRLISIGCLIMLACIAVGLTGHSVHSYWWALILLGVGWNFLFVCGTSLLPKVYKASERFKVQATNDFSITAFQASGSLGAGMVLFSQGWEWMLIVSIFPIAILFLTNYVVKKQEQKPMTQTV